MDTLKNKEVQPLVVPKVDGAFVSKEEAVKRSAEVLRRLAVVLVIAEREIYLKKGGLMQ